MMVPSAPDRGSMPPVVVRGRTRRMDILDGAVGSVPQIYPPVEPDAWALLSRYPGRHHLGIPSTIISV